MKHQKISKKAVDQAVSRFIDHRLWYRVLQAYTVQATWTTAELRDYLGLKDAKNILACAQTTLQNLGYSMLPVEKNTKRSKYYLRKLTQIK